MDLLKSASFETLGAGGTVTVPANHTGHDPCNSAAVQGVFECDQNVTGVGTIHVQWAITGPLPAATPAQTLFVDLVAQPVARATRQRATAHFTAFRTDNN
jgi:hypothetical protein